MDAMVAEPGRRNDWAAQIGLPADLAVGPLYTITDAIARAKVDVVAVYRRLIEDRLGSVPAPELFAGGGIKAQHLASRMLGMHKEPAIAQADKYLASVHRWCAPHRQVGRCAPQHLAIADIQSKNLGLSMSHACAGAGVKTLADDCGARIDMDVAAETPAPAAGHGVQTVDAIIPRTKEHAVLGDAGTRLYMASRRKVPALSAGGRVETVQLAMKILVHSLAQVKLAVRQARRGKRLLHVAAIVKPPNALAGVPIQAIQGTAGRAFANVADDGHIKAIAGNERRRQDCAPLPSFECPGVLRSRYAGSYREGRALIRVRYC